MIVNYNSVCIVVSPFAVPQCIIDIYITFCKVKDCEITIMSGKITAYGTDPDPYVINGGTRDLFVAGGKIDSE